MINTAHPSIVRGELLLLVFICRLETFQLGELPMTTLDVIQAGRNLQGAELMRLTDGLAMAQVRFNALSTEGGDISETFW